MDDFFGILTSMRVDASVSCDTRASQLLWLEKRVRTPDMCSMCTFYKLEVDRVNHELRTRQSIQKLLTIYTRSPHPPDDLVVFVDETEFSDAVSLTPFRPCRTNPEH